MRAKKELARIRKELARIQAPEHTVEDIDLENRISIFLQQRQIPNGKRIHADARMGTVVVSGKLPSRRAKSLCMECCRHVAGVMKLIDHVVVEPETRHKQVEPRLVPTRKSLLVTASVLRRLLSRGERISGGTASYQADSSKAICAFPQQ